MSQLASPYSDRLFEELRELLGEDALSREPAIVNSYAEDDSFASPTTPAFVVWPRSSEKLQEIVRRAGKYGIPLIPISSGLGFRQHGDTVPTQAQSVIVDLSRMNRILRIDVPNRVVMVEPGVTFSQLIPEVEKNGLRLMQPLLPRSGKSVLTSALEREPTIIPRFHWDTSDPLLCTEIVFGTGDLFRTGSAAGPGTIDEQLAAGSAQKNPMGPTQFNLFQTIQGAQGSLGIVTWVSLKCELKPKLQKLFFAQAEDLGCLIPMANEALRMRLGDELFLMSRQAFSSFAKESSQEIGALGQTLKEWVFLICLGGRGQFANEKVGYQEADLADMAKRLNISLEPGLAGLEDCSILDLLHTTKETPWQYNAHGGCQSIFFITTLDRVPSFVRKVKSTLKEAFGGKPECGVYIQPQVQGCNCHLEFQLYYDPGDKEESDNTRRAFNQLSQELMDEGAFFSRPYGCWAPTMYSKVSPQVVQTLWKVKKIFDPGNIMKPGSLCFGEVDP